MWHCLYPLHTDTNCRSPFAQFCLGLLNLLLQWSWVFYRLCTQTLWLCRLSTNKLLLKLPKIRIRHHSTALSNGWVWTLTCYWSHRCHFNCLYVKWIEKFWDCFHCATNTFQSTLQTVFICIDGLWIFQFYD